MRGCVDAWDCGGGMAAAWQGGGGQQQSLQKGRVAGLCGGLTWTSKASAGEQCWLLNACCWLDGMPHSALQLLPSLA